MLFLKKFKHHKLEILENKPNHEVISLNQTHSNKVIHESKMMNIHESKQSTLEGDGIIFNNDTVSQIAMITADCLPIYLFGENESAFIHAGWKGIYNKILSQDSIIQIRPSYAYIGPHIKECCFEVGAEFTDYFTQENHCLKKNNKLYCNLLKITIAQLKEINPNIIIEASVDCTYCHQKYHSYRRNKTNKRNWNIISKL